MLPYFEILQTLGTCSSIEFFESCFHLTDYFMRCRILCNSIFFINHNLLLYFSNIANLNCILAFYFNLLKMYVFLLFVWRNQTQQKCAHVYNKQCCIIVCMELGFVFEFYNNINQKIQLLFSRS